MDFFNNKVIESIDLDKVRAEKSFPWISLHEVLTPEGFEALHRDFPPLYFFNYHENLSRGFRKQRPHDRYYASYITTPYMDIFKETGKGIINPQDLEQSWQAFIKELASNDVYHKFVLNLLGNQKFGVNLAWHVGISGNEVSPHLDSKSKIGTHLLYFNTSDDWNDEWGGEFLVLEKIKKDVPNPDFDDFEKVTPVPIMDNRSLIFKNTSNAWHGVRPLNCPDGKCRRLVNIIFNEIK